MGERHERMGESAKRNLKGNEMQCRKGRGMQGEWRGIMGESSIPAHFSWSESGGE